MDQISKMPALSIEELKKTIRCAVDVRPEGEGFVAEFHLKLCQSPPEYGISEEPKLFWRSSTRCISACDIGTGNPYGSAIITREISQNLTADYTTVLGEVLTDQNPTDVWFESGDPRKATHMLMLPLNTGEYMSNSRQETEMQDVAILYAANNDHRWGFKRYALLDIGYYCVRNDSGIRNYQYTAQAEHYRKIAVAELILTGHCSRELAEEFFPGLSRNIVVNGNLLAASFGEKTLKSSKETVRYYAIAADGGMILPKVRHEHDGVTEDLWWDLPEDALVFSCDFDHSRKDCFSVTPIYGSLGEATREQHAIMIMLVQAWLV